MSRNLNRKCGYPDCDAIVWPSWIVKKAALVMSELPKRGEGVIQRGRLSHSSRDFGKTTDPFGDHLLGFICDGGVDSEKRASPSWSNWWWLIKWDVLLMCISFRIWTLALVLGGISGGTWLCQIGKFLSEMHPDTTARYFAPKSFFFSSKCLCTLCVVFLTQKCVKIIEFLFLII